MVMLLFLVLNYGSYAILATDECCFFFLKNMLNIKHVARELDLPQYKIILFTAYS